MYKKYLKFQAWPPVLTLTLTKKLYFINKTYKINKYLWHLTCFDILKDNSDTIPYSKYIIHTLFDTSMVNN